MTSHSPLGPVDATAGPAVRRPADLRPAAAARPGRPRGRRRPRRAVRLRGRATGRARASARRTSGQSSQLLRPYNPALDVEPFAAAAGRRRRRRASTRSTSPRRSRTIEAGARRPLERDGAALLTLGGDHTIALPLLRVAARRHGPVAVLHFDAHLDTWDTYFGAPYTHGTPFRRAAEEGLLDLERCLHVGIRGPLYSRHGSGGRRAPRLRDRPRRRLRDRRRRRRRRADARAARRRPGLRLASTSTCSTPRTRRARARPRPAV